MNEIVFQKSLHFLLYQYISHQEHLFEASNKGWVFLQQIINNKLSMISPLFFIILTFQHGTKLMTISIKSKAKQRMTLIKIPLKTNRNGNFTEIRTFKVIDTHQNMKIVALSCCLFCVFLLSPKRLTLFFLLNNGPSLLFVIVFHC